MYNVFRPNLRYESSTDEEESPQKTDTSNTAKRKSPRKISSPRRFPDPPKMPSPPIVSSLSSERVPDLMIQSKRVIESAASTSSASASSCIISNKVQGMLNLYFNI